MEDLCKNLKELKDSFEISPDEQKDIIKNLLTEMNKGLIGAKSSLKMIPSYVEPPTGYKNGNYLVIDFGGTNLRLMQINLGEKATVLKKEEVIIEEKIKTATKDEFFDYISNALSNFIRNNHLDDPIQQQNLGFTFSFPVNKESINSGKLLEWTKGYDIKGVKGKDVVKLLNISMEKIGIKNIKIVSLLNDAVGTLVYRKYINTDCDVSVILGTGTNAAYIENISKIKKLKAFSIQSRKSMIINTEWGNFNKLRMTDYDRKLDEMSENPGKYKLEKMISAKYIAELTKIIISDFIGKNNFSDNMKSWNNSQLFDAEDMSEIICDNSTELNLVREKLRKFDVNNSVLIDREILKSICKIVMDRSAKIVATLIVGIILKIDRELNRTHIVAIDGTLYEKATWYKDKLRENIDNLLGEKRDKIKLKLTKDGSGKGAAVAAATAIINQQK